MLCGDISTNPGPIKYSWIECGRPVKCNQQALMCDFCDRWVHRKCTNPLLCESDFYKLEDSNVNFYCQTCVDRLLEFSESYFENSTLGDETFSWNSSNVANKSGVGNESYLTYTENDSRDVESDVHEEVFREIRQAHSKYKNNVIITHLNVNSLRYKFMEAGELLYDKLSDICFFFRRDEIGWHFQQV